MTYFLPLVAAIAFSTAPAKPHAPRTELLSKRALRQAKLLIAMRLYELREEHLECVRMAILRRLPWDLRPHDPVTHCLEADFSPK